jgi:predicted ATPase
LSTEISEFERARDARSSDIWSDGFEAARRGFTNLVGLAAESALLRDLLRAAWAGAGQIVLLSGEAGIGKSRLAAQLAAEVANEPHTRLRYQCSPYHRDSVLHPFVVQLGAWRPPRPRGPGRDAARQARSHIGAGAHRRNGPRSASRQKRAVYSAAVIPRTCSKSIRPR